ncbi:MAG: hypothetical protein KKE20_04490 [Nanoarchaeota archaeon]|nr:hypothetical protein [Nanoarchaeota archaeon]
MRKSHYILALILFITLATRLILAFQTPQFTGPESYFAIRQIEHISSTGFPLFHDDLSYGGREDIFTPFFYYFMAFFDLFLPIGIVGKVVPNLLVSLIVILVYMISKDISNDEDASLFSAFVAGFIPVFYKETLNTISVYALAFPLMLFMILCFLRITKKDYPYYFLISLLLLVLTSPSVAILLLGFVFYMALVKLEDHRQSRVEIEVILFSIVFTVWIMFIIFKKAFLMHGPLVIWQNIPPEILKIYFSQTTIIGAIYQIGSLPISYGVYAVYDHLFRNKERKFYLIIGMAFSTGFLLWLRLIEVGLGLMCIGIVATLLLPKFYKFSFDYLKKTRFARFKTLYLLSLFVAFIFASVIPSIVSGMDAVDRSLTDSEYQSFIWLKQNTKEDSIIISSAEKGTMIASVSERANIADMRFLLQKDATQRINDIRKLYQSRFETEALGVLTRYGVDYIYFSDKEKNDFSVDDLVFTENRQCFSLEYDKDIKIYKVGCELK